MISGYTRIHRYLTGEYEIEAQDATRAIDAYMRIERETISDSITDKEVEELATDIYDNSNYWK